LSLLTEAAVGRGWSLAEQPKGRSGVEEGGRRPLEHDGAGPVNSSPCRRQNQRDTRFSSTDKDHVTESVTKQSQSRAIQRTVTHLCRALDADRSI